MLEKQLKPLSDQWAEYSIPASNGWKHDLIDPLGENVGRSREIYRTILPMYRLPVQRSISASEMVSFLAR